MLRSRNFLIMYVLSSLYSLVVNLEFLVVNLRVQGTCQSLILRKLSLQNIPQDGIHTSRLQKIGKKKLIKKTLVRNIAQIMIHIPRNHQDFYNQYQKMDFSYLAICKEKEPIFFFIQKVEQCSETNEKSNFPVYTNFSC